MTTVGSNIIYSDCRQLGYHPMMTAIRAFMRTLIIVASTALLASEARANEQHASAALQAWGNFVESVNFLDSCSHRNDISALKPLLKRLEMAESGLARRYPHASANSVGETDFICNPEYSRSDHRALRKMAIDLITQIEIEAAR
jgi:hypothetical protein